MDTDTDFRDILRNEGRFSPSDTLIDRLLENSDEISLKSGKVLIGYGQTDTNSPQSVYMNQPAVMQIESCRIASSVLRIRRDVFLSLMRESHEFSLWMFDIAMGQFYTSECKMIQINGSAEERYRNLLKFRPDIANVISANRMASYLNVTPSWLCKIRKKLLYE